MSSVNKVIILGNVGRDPEIRPTKTGDRIANFSIATSEKWTAKDGGKQEKTQWHNIVVFSDGIAGVVQQFVRKGSKVYIEGTLETRKWTDKSGSERYSTEVVVKGFGGQLVLLDGKPDGANGNYAQKDAFSVWHDEPAQDDMSDFDDKVPF